MNVITKPVNFNLRIEALTPAYYFTLSLLQCNHSFEGVLMHWTKHNGMLAFVLYSCKWTRTGLLSTSRAVHDISGLAVIEYPVVDVNGPRLYSLLSWSFMHLPLTTKTREGAKLYIRDQRKVVKFHIVCI
jgi:hypothetical protein